MLYAVIILYIAMSCITIQYCILHHSMTLGSFQSINVFSYLVFNMTDVILLFLNFLSTTDKERVGRLRERGRKQETEKERER